MLLQDDIFIVSASATHWVVFLFFVAVFSYFLKFLISHYFVSLILSSFVLSLVITFPFLCVNHFISVISDEVVAEAS